MYYVIVGKLKNILQVSAFEIFDIQKFYFLKVVPLGN